MKKRGFMVRDLKEIYGDRRGEPVKKVIASFLREDPIHIGVYIHASPKYKPKGTGVSAVGS